MLILLAKLLIPIFPPLAATIAWKKYKPTTWTPALAALVAITLYALAKIPLQTYVMHNSNLFPAEFGLAPTFGPRFVSISLIYGTARTIIHSLVISYPLAGMSSWQNGILFALSYTTFAAVMNTWRELTRKLIFTAARLDLIPDPTVPQIEMIATLRQVPLSTVTARMNEHLPAITLLFQSLDWNINAFILNLGTTLAIVYAVRRKKIWPIPAAVFCYAVMILPQMLWWPTLAFGFLRDLIIKEEGLISFTLSLLADVLGSNTFIVIATLMPTILAALPALALGLYFRKKMANADS